jgi:energy-coupling factor transporter ATP-binding protein EcfA2
MYLKNIFIENMGAIEKFSLEEKDLIKKDGNPKVVIFVGQNGSGKTTLLSSIVDSFYQLAQGSFDDILPKYGMGYKYFKISGMNNKRVHTEYGFSYLQFEKDSKKYEYIDKNGKLSFEECQSKTNNLLTLNNKWKSEGNHKENTSTKNGDDFSKDFQANSYCYFPSDRFEYPYWINEETVHQQEQFNDYSSFSGRLDKGIIIRQSLSEIKHWILDVFLDSRTGIIFNIDGSVSTETHIDDVKQLQQSRINLEIILSKIMEKDILIDLNYRGRGNSRLKLINKATKKDELPSLNNLSAGQSTLLGIFANIIKSSDKNDLTKSINLSEIEGIVVIDVQNSVKLWRIP